MTEQVEARLAKLEARVAELERGDASAPVGGVDSGGVGSGGVGSDAVDSDGVGSDGVGSDAGDATGGVVSYQGEVHLYGDVSWSIGYASGAILELSVPRTTDVLAALGHPVRLQIVRMLLRGPANAADLQAAVGLGSTGQVYHHLKTLVSANIVEQQARGDYRIGAKKVVPLLVSMLAAADISGELGT